MLVFNVRIDPEHLPYREIIEYAETRAVTGNILREYLIARLLEDTNVLARVCETGVAVGASLRAAALDDLAPLLVALEGDHGVLDGYRPSASHDMRFAAYQRSLASAVAAEGAEATLDAIIAHYRAFGGGEGGQYVAFLWDGALRGVPAPDDIALERLYCLSEQKRELLANTRAFLDGLPANNVLLYGNSGCGKSSMVKALLGAYHADGLRLVQIQKDDLPELPLLIRQIRDRRFRYIVFMDDLSFEGDDIGYKTLKTILDGSIEKQPENILFYATSNRLHLISESWAERKGNDVHVADTRNEKLSLSERFGLRLSFLSPGQEEYLEMVAGILAEAGVRITEAMRADAVSWAWQCNGLSGRTAAQYAATILREVRHAPA